MVGRAMRGVWDRVLFVVVVVACSWGTIWLPKPWSLWDDDSVTLSGPAPPQDTSHPPISFDDGRPLSSRFTGFRTESTPVRTRSKKAPASNSFVKARPAPQSKSCGWARTPPRTLSDAPTNVPTAASRDGRARVDAPRVIGANVWLTRRSLTTTGTPRRRIWPSSSTKWASLAAYLRREGVGDDDDDEQFERVFGSGTDAVCGLCFV
jgi:hypothetical protein